MTFTQWRTTVGYFSKKEGCISRNNCLAMRKIYSMLIIGLIDWRNEGPRKG